MLSRLIEALMDDWRVVTASRAVWLPAAPDGKKVEVMMQKRLDVGGTRGAMDRTAWRLKAKIQGLVCLVCGKIPALERRPEFYDTGLCRGCADELGDKTRDFA